MAKVKPEIVLKNIKKMTNKKLKLSEKKICKATNPREYNRRYTVGGRKKYIASVRNKYGIFKSEIVAETYNRFYGKLY